MVMIEMCFKLNRIINKFQFWNQNMLIIVIKLRVMIIFFVVKDGKEIINECWFEF